MTANGMIRQGVTSFKAPNTSAIPSKQTTSSQRFGPQAKNMVQNPLMSVNTKIGKGNMKDEGPSPVSTSIEHAGNKHSIP